MRLISIALLLYCFSFDCQAQGHTCDSLYYGDTTRFSKYQNNDPDLVLLYRTAHITIKAPLSEIIKEAKTLKLTEKEIRERAECFKRLNLEADIAEFNFCNRAKKFACELLDKNACCIIIDGEVVKTYKEIGYRSKNCLHYTRFVFSHDVYYYLEDIRLLD